MDNLFEKVKAVAKIKEVCIHFGGMQFNSSKMAKCCFHEESNPSFSVEENKNIFRCFSCGEGGDSIDFVAKIMNIEPLEAAKELARFYGLDEPPTGGSSGAAQIPRTIQKERVAANKAQKREDIAASVQCGKVNKAKIKAYLEECILHAKDTNYFVKRGLTADTIRHFKLGFDPSKNAVVVPYSSKLDYYQTRSVEGKEFRKPPAAEAGLEPLYGANLLSGKGYIFVVESPICAMSISQCGGVAIALCGAGNAQKFVREVQSKKSKATFILCLDNDGAGQKAQEDLARGLFDIGAKFVDFNIAGECKDPNDLLIKDGEQLTKNIRLAVEAARKKYRTDKDSISARELCSEEHVRPRHVIENLIVEGLTLFCAPQKIGKSWLVLDMCFKVAMGEDFWAYKTEKCGALYYCLEDTKWRIDDRIKKLHARCPDADVSFITVADKLGDGFLEHLDEELSRNPNIGLVVIDTLKMIRKVNAKNNDVYGHDYEELHDIKAFAEKKKIAIVVVHHTRKTKDNDDPFVNVSGTGGVTGAVDTTMVLMKKKRSDKEATLSVTGRDVEERDLIVEWTKSNWRWTMCGNAEEMQAKRERDEFTSDPFIKTVKEMVKAQPYGVTLTPTELSLRVYDVTGDTNHTPNIIGAKITKWKTKLYYDGIDHSEKKVNGQKKHTFCKRSYRPPQGSFFASNSETDD